MNVLELKSYRIRKGYTQLEISKKLLMALKTYNRKELGIVNFTPIEIVKLSEILDLTIDEINQIFFDNKLTNRLNLKR